MRTKNYPVSRSILHGALALVISCALLEPVHSNAQTAEPVVIVCPVPGPVPDYTDTYTLDMTAKTVAIETRYTLPNGQLFHGQGFGTITAVTDKEIDWKGPPFPERSDAFNIYVLNRFTLDLYIRTTIYSGQSHNSCHKQDRQL